MGNSYFASIIGHDKIKKRLLHLIETDRMPHAMIFAGPAGLGKTLMAIGTASALLQRPVLTSWQEHQEEAMLRDRDDVYFLAPQGAMLKVDQFRQLQEQLMLMGSLDSKRLCIIDHVETMNKEFANRMLKILEEPPQGVYFILVTNQVDMLLPTIISRCAVISFEPVGDEEMRNGLVRLRGGELRQYDQAVLWGGGNVENVLKLLAGSDLDGVRYALDFLRFLANHACPYAKWLTVSVAFSDRESTEIMHWIGMLLRDILVLRSGAAADQIRLKQYKDDLLEILPYWPDSSIFVGMEVLDEGLEAIQRHVNTRLVWDYVSIRFQQAKGGV